MGRTHLYPANISSWPKVGLLLDQRLMFAGYSQTHGIFYAENFKTFICFHLAVLDMEKQFYKLYNSC